MNVFPTLLCLSLLAGSHAPAGAVGHRPAIQQMSTPEAEYNALGVSAMALVQRALSQPTDAAALALLRKETPALRQRAQKLRLTYAKWYKSLSAQEVAGVQERIQRSSFGGYFGSLETDSGLNVRLRNNPALNKAVDNVTSTLSVQ